MAIALVLESHFRHGLPLDAGRLGVDLFFALSGYLMAGILFLQRQPLSTFYKRRVSRIYPVFAMYLAVAYGLAHWRGAPIAWQEPVSSLLFLRTYWPQEPGLQDTPVGVIIRHTWSLNVEEHAYLLMSLIAMTGVLARRAAWLLAAIGLAAMATTAIIASSAPPWTAFTGTETAIAPLVLAGGYRLLRSTSRLPGHGCVAPLSILGAALSYWQGLSWPMAHIIGPVLLAVAINHLEHAPVLMLRLLSIRALTWLGLLSYSLYLWQQPFYELRRSFPGGHAIALLAAVATAVTSYLVLERPVRNWLNRHW